MLAKCCLLLLLLGVGLIPSPLMAQVDPFAAPVFPHGYHPYMVGQPPGGVPPATPYLPGGWPSGSPVQATGFSAAETTVAPVPAHATGYLNDRRDWAPDACTLDNACGDSACFDNACGDDACGASKPKFPIVRVTGFFHLDAGWFSQDRRNIETVGDAEDGVSFRRARLAATGEVAEDVAYIIEMDFAASQPRFVDVWMEFRNTPILGNIRIGRWRQPNGMAELTSVRELPFLERASPFAMTPFRQTGIGFWNHTEDERATWAASVVRAPSDFFGNNVGDQGGYGVVGRFTWLPCYEDDGARLLHVGCDFDYLEPSQDSIRFAYFPEVLITQSDGGLLPAPLVGEPLFVDTGLIPAQNVKLFGAECAFALGNFYFQSEARWLMVDRIGGDTLTLPGGYAQARYVLTGEKLPYKKTQGVFGRIVPRENFKCHGSPGAWELAARWSYVDFNGPMLVPGRRMENVTLGVNWYLNAFTKFQFNYIRAALDDPIQQESLAHIAAILAQIDF